MGVLSINKDKDFTMQIGLLFPWKLLLSHAGVSAVLFFVAFSFSLSLSLRRVLANINVEDRYVTAVSAIFITSLRFNGIKIQAPKCFMANVISLLCLDAGLRVLGIRSV